MHVMINQLRGAICHMKPGTASDHVINTVGSVGMQPQLLLPIPGSEPVLVSTNFRSMCEQFDHLIRFSVNDQDVRKCHMATQRGGAMHLETDKCCSG